MDDYYLDSDKTILVVDDATINIAKAEYILKPRNYEVIGVSSGRECLDLLKSGEKKIDLMLLDIEMPGMDGVEVLRAVRDMPDYYYLPVIFVTGHTDTEFILEGAKLHIAGYIKKPFVAEELIKRVEMCFDMDD